MSARDPDGHDVDYLEWHAVDHVPELHRVPGLRGALRGVSTPACRGARAVSNERYDAVDHVMTYLFADRASLEPFGAVAAALGQAGRMPLRLPSVEMGTYELAGTAAAPRVLVAADVIAWRPARGIYFLVEAGTAPAGDLVDVPGVAGAWWFRTTADDGTTRQLTCCYLDDDPVETAPRLRPALEQRWSGGDVVAHFAAPFHTVVPYDWGRFLP
jgi:hypothetical protein